MLQLLWLICLDYVDAITCHSSCVECFADNDNESCTLCADGFLLTGNGFTCLPEVADVPTGTPGGCVTEDPVTGDYEANDYLLDASDDTCKSTIYSNDYPCPHGTYSASARASSQEFSCSACRPTKYCASRAQSADSGDCAAGFYCTEYSAFEKPLRTLVGLVGYLGDYDNDYCTSGYYCESASEAPTICEAGHYCPIPLTAKSPQYCIANPSDADCVESLTGTCTPGFDCTGGSNTPTPIDCLLDSDDDTSICGDICQPGYYCEGDVAAQPCPLGTFYPAQGAKAETDCIQCSPGSFCDDLGMAAPAGLCSEGFYCPGGNTEAAPIQFECPAGYYCPEGSVAPRRCVAGEFTDGPGKAECEVCLAQYYCTENGRATACPAGHYCPGDDLKIECPIGTYRPRVTQSPYPSSVNDCLQCDSGFACAQSALVTTSQPCEEGFYCAGGTQTTMPGSDEHNGGMCHPGTYCALQSSDAEDCPQGYYCKDYASSMPTALCPAGYRCPTGTDHDSWQSTDNQCQPGHYCITGSYEQEPCPVGTYSPSIGAISLDNCMECPIGYACDETGLSAYTPNGALNIELDACPAGYYCEDGTSTLTVVEQLSNQPVQCEVGYECPPNTAIKKECQPGFYQDQVGQSACKQCEAGYYCDGTSPTAQVDCPPGYYCPLGTKFAHAYPCPKGRYNSQTNGASLSDCLLCDANYYCEHEGMDEQSTLILAGYFNLNPGQVWPSLNTAQDSDGSDLESYATDPTKPQWCPQYFYCPAGTIAPLPCEDGTWTPWTGSKDASECIPCERGKFCRFATMIEDHGPLLTEPGHYRDPRTRLLDQGVNFDLYFDTCSDGYVCLEGTAANPTSDNEVDGAFACPVGHYCTDSVPGYNAQIAPIPCEYGYYQDETGKASCKKCVEGNYCGGRGLAQMSPCLQGHYCPEKASFPVPCLKGTYSAVLNSAAPNDCTQCDPGSYCGETGLLAPSGPCASGFVCSGGAITPTPWENVFQAGVSPNGRCPAGHYCPSQSSEPVVCPVGQYQPNEGATQCVVCDPGYYCDLPGLTTPAGECDGGHYCKFGAKEASPTDGVTGDICPSGYYCPEGSAGPLNCPDGFNSTEEGLEQCAECPDGYMCTGGAPAELCGAHRYCSNNEDYPFGRLCPNGTYLTTDANGVATADDCLPCPAGQYCIGGRNGYDCSAGYICLAGANSPTPWARRDECDLPRNWALQPNTFLTDSDLEVSIQEILEIYEPECQEGNIWCSEEESSSTSTYRPYWMDITYEYGAFGYSDSSEESTVSSFTPRSCAFACPIGYYCTEGTATIQSCPDGYYTYETGARQEGECSTCLGGFYCERGEDEPTECPQGHYCPAGSEAPTPCAEGTYNPNARRDHRDDCLPCLGGYYCNERAIGNLYTYGDQYVCPDGYFCPIGTSRPQPCPPGTYSSVADTFRMPARYEDCTICPEHHYCGRGTVVPTPCTDGTFCDAGSGAPTLCPAGYVCTWKNVEECPVGSYCPVGTAVPIPCDAEAGQVCDEPGLMTPRYALDNTEGCAEGTYWGYGQCFPCEPGFMCLGGSDQRFPLYPLEERGQECPPGHHCAQGTSGWDGVQPPVECPAGTHRTRSRGEEPGDCSLCPTGTYNTLTGQADCQGCGAGATSVPDRLSCQCVGAFRTWKESTKECMCETGYREPNTTQAVQTTTALLDCVPLLQPACSPGTHRDEITNECVSNEVCAVTPTCDDGFYDETLRRCMCNFDDYVNPCDSECQAALLEVYYEAQAIRIAYPLAAEEWDGIPESEFPSMLFGGLSCDPSAPCRLQAIDPATMSASYEPPAVFIDFWNAAGNVTQYVSPEGANGRRLQESTAPSVIMVLSPGDAATFETSAEHYPVYRKDSDYNTNPNFDDGVFDQLELSLVSAGANIESFAFTFVTAGTYVFQDSSDPAAQTIVHVTDEEPSMGYGFFPMTSANIEELGLGPQELPMKVLPEALQLIPFLALVFAFAMLAAQEYYFSRLAAARDEKKKNKKKKIEDMQGQKEQILSYIDDLQALIRQNLEEVKKKLDETKRPEDQRKLAEVIADKISVLNELGDVEDMDQIIVLIKHLCGNMRFADGRSLEDVLKELRLRKNLDEKVLSDEQTESYDDEEPEEEGDEEAEEEVEDDTDSLYDEIEEEERQMVKDQLDPEMLEMIAAAEAEQKNKRDRFRQHLEGLDDREKDRLLKGLDGKLGSMQAELEAQQKMEQDRLKERLARRKGRRKKAEDKLDAAVKVLDDEAKKLEEAADKIQEEKAQIEFDDLNNEENQKERDEERVKEEARLQEKKEEAIKNVRDEYMNKIRGARSEAEKEKLLTEMQDRIRKVEAQAERERRQQLKQLEKNMKNRQRRRLKKKLAEKEAERQALVAEHVAVEHAREVEMLRLYADGEDVVPEGLQDTVQRIVDRAEDEKQEILSTKRKDNHERDLIQAQHDDEMNKALRAAELEIEESLEEERAKLEDAGKQKLRNRKRALEQKLANCTDRKEKRDLMKQLEEMDKARDKMLDDERAKQERLLAEKRAARLARKKIRELEVSKQQAQELVDKECADDRKDTLDHLSDLDGRVRAGLEAQLDEVAKRRGLRANKEQGLVLVKETVEEVHEKKMSLLRKREYAELQRRLANVVQGAEVSRAIGRMQANLDCKEGEIDAAEALSGAKLANKLDALKAEKNRKLNIVDSGVEEEQREREFKVREQCENDFFKEREAVVLADTKTKRELLKKFMDENPDDLVQEIGTKLLLGLNREEREKIMELERERDAAIQQAQCRVIADDAAGVRDVMASFGDQVAAEEASITKTMGARLDAIKAERKRQLEQAKKELIEAGVGNVAAELAKMKMQLESEMGDMESALLREQQQQLARLRKAKLSRRMAKEKKRRQKEAQDKQETARLQTKIDLETRATKRMQSMARGRTVDLSEMAEAEDLLRILLRKWADNVSQSGDLHIWEKDPATGGGPAIQIDDADDKSPRGLDASFDVKEETGFIGDRQQHEFSVAELFRRLRRIEKLTRLIREREEQTAGQPSRLNLALL